MYDKFGRVLRLETTTNDVSFFKHHRKVEHQDGHPTRELAALKKTIYSLIDLREILLGCNRRYLEFLSALQDTSGGERDLARLCEPQRDGDRTIKGLELLRAAPSSNCCGHCSVPEFNIHGVRRADLKPFVPTFNATRTCRVNCTACEHWA